MQHRKSRYSLNTK